MTNKQLIALGVIIVALSVLLAYILQQPSEATRIRCETTSLYVMTEEDREFCYSKGWRTHLIPGKGIEEDYNNDGYYR